MTNPFTLSFGTIPTEFISRPVQTLELLNNFLSEKPSTNMYMITGVRGAGKTVMLTEISKELRKNENWIVIEVSPESSITESIISNLYNLEKIRPLFIKLKINLSHSGAGISIENSSPDMTSEVMLEKMLQILKKNSIRLMIVIDEVTNNQYVKRFAHTFQIMIRQEYDIYIIMTGLYENIYNLQNEKSLTFLYRAPKISLAPLSITSIANSYASIFSIEKEIALELAKTTCGYPFAFQVLGYLCWSKKDTNIANLVEEYDQYLSEYVYDKIWSELTEKDKQILFVISEQKDYVKIQLLRENTGMSSSLFSSYRDKLIRKGIVDVSRYGYINMILPRFREYVQFRKAFDEL